ncbi:hypothetical protein TL16_g06653 [Triparma laevis f. inornata]|uniref:Uncharacterized protein n=2 Tax=Triparma laevis TaxID=1534972 RepID=A0A9W7L065_9STRA|nr:hypothetical protein TL16_g06653 [Triparma laevis f. inornata]GMI18408.1 hypothetical protein TrLO_g15677 [Triparma laevis f. longispina]
MNSFLFFLILLFICSSAAAPPSSPPALDNVAFFQRRRTRIGSLPFIIITPTAEHWGAVGESLSSIGFSVLVCQVESAEDGHRIVEGEEAVALVKSILNTMCWKKAILVGCDVCSLTALDAANALSSNSDDDTPSIAGLILAGDLLPLAIRERTSDSSNSNSNSTTQSTSTSTSTKRRFNPKTLPGRTALLMCALKDVDCPYSIIVDEVTTPQTLTRRFPLNFLHKSSTCLQKEQDEAEWGVASQAVLVGGGFAPHRRLPEQFSWVLSRFFEERLIPEKGSTPTRLGRLRRRVRKIRGNSLEEVEQPFTDSEYESDEDKTETCDPYEEYDPLLSAYDETTPTHNLNPIAALAPILKPSSSSSPTKKRRRRPTLFEPATYLVFGRVLANTILYTTAFGVVIIQGKNIAGGAVELRNQVRDLPQNLRDVPKRIPSAIGRTLNRIGKETYKIIATPEVGEGGAVGGGGLGVGIGSAVHNFNKMLKHFRGRVEAKKNDVIDKIEKEKQDLQGEHKARSGERSEARTKSEERSDELV